MKYENKTKKQLIDELEEKRLRVAELEVSETERKRFEESLKAEQERLELTLRSVSGGITNAKLSYLKN